MIVVGCEDYRGGSRMWRTGVLVIGVEGGSDWGRM